MALAQAIRYCRCGTRLASDNPQAICSACQRTARELLLQAPQVPDDFWEAGELRDALARREMGLVSRAYRQHPYHGSRPLPQDRVAAWIGLTQGQLSRIERGENQVRDLDALIHWARTPRLPPRLAWFYVPDLDVGGHSAPAGADDAQQTTVTPTPPIPFDTLRVEPQIAAHLRNILAEYSGVDNLTGPRPLLTAVPAQLALVEELLRDARGEVRRELLDVGTRCAELTGWLSQDAGDLQAAVRWSERAVGYAVELGDPRLVSYVLMRKSNVASDEHDAESALGLARAALRDWDCLTPRLRAVALRQEAHAHALGGNAQACARSLDKAIEQVVVGTDRETEFDLTVYCTPAYIGMEAAACWIELGQPKQAIQALEQGLKAWMPEFKRDLGLCLARLALAHAAGGDAEQAYTVGQHALSIVKDARSARTLRELGRLDVQLAKRCGSAGTAWLTCALAELGQPQLARNTS